eukprot:gene3479-6128_t
MNKCFVAIDNGTSSIKSIKEVYEKTENVSRIPNEFGRPFEVTKIEEKEYYIGESLNQKRKELSISSPVERGVIKNFVDIEKIWDFVYNDEFKLNSKETPTFFTETVFYPKKIKEECVEILMETFEVPYFLSEKTTILSTYANGCTTGFIIEIGDGLTQLDAICEGYQIGEAAKKFERGGIDFTQYLSKYINPQLSNDYSKTKLFQNIKEQYSYIPIDLLDEVRKFSKGSDLDVKYKLPDGSLFNLKKELILGYDDLCSDWAEDIVDVFCSINSFELKSKLEKSIILTGGVSNTKGYSEFISNFFQNSLPMTSKQKYIKSIIPNDDSLLGGSVLVSMSSFDDSWLKKEQYNEQGYYKKIK